MFWNKFKVTCLIKSITSSTIYNKTNNVVQCCLSCLKKNTKPCCQRTSSSCCDKCRGRLVSQLPHDHYTYHNSTAFKAALWKKPDLQSGKNRFAMLRFGKNCN